MAENYDIFTFSRVGQHCGLLHFPEYDGFQLGCVGSWQLGGGDPPPVRARIADYLAVSYFHLVFTSFFGAQELLAVLFRTILFQPCTLTL